MDVMNPLNEYGGFFNHRLIMGIFCLCSDKRKCNINGSQGLESQTHLKWDMFGGAMESSVVTVMNIVETLIPCTWLLIIVHVQDVHNHPIDDLCLAFILGVKRSAFCELGVQQRPKNRPKCVEELVVLVGYDGVWYPKVEPHSFEEEIGTNFRYDFLISSCEDGHLRKPINDQKYAAISFLSGRQARHVIQLDGFPRILENRKRGV
jgi:hypothetical protein